MNRKDLYARINARVDKMIASGLEDEVKSLMEYKDYNSLQTVGYFEWIDYFDGKISLEKAVELIKQNSRRYAKRQLTWFNNKDKEIKWFLPNEKKNIMDYLKIEIKK